MDGVYICPCCKTIGVGCKPCSCNQDIAAWLTQMDGTPLYPFPPDITSDDLATITEGMRSNPDWFEAVVAAAEVQASRRAKYSGSGDPYTNFIKMSELLDVPMDEVFRFYCGIKMTRLAVTDSDFSDEKVNDTLVDLANYALLWRGWRERVEAATQTPTASQDVSVQG
jgi:hypothetical protein